MKRWFIAIVATQLVFLIGETVYYRARLESGIEVRLKVVPVDPRSMFMGNYMNLSYDISSIDVRILKASLLDPKKLRPGQTLYVSLDTTGPTAKVYAVSNTQPAVLEPGRIYLKSRVRRNWSDLWWQSRSGNIVVDYGISRYFIPENKQHEVNRLNRWGNSTSNTVVVASVNPDGQAMIKRVEVNGKRLEY